jgi:hypothetical protein
MRSKKSLFISICFASVILSAAACRVSSEDEESTRSAQSRLEPGVVEGNPTCASLGLGTAFVKDEDAKNGTFALGADGSVTVSNADGNTFDWSATIGIDAVIVKGGPNANVYVYDPESMGGSGLHAPVNPANGTFYGLSHIDFCYDVEPCTPGTPGCGPCTPGTEGCPDGGSSSGGSSSGGSSSGGSSSGGSSSGGSSSGGSSSGGSSSGQTW